MMHLAKMMERKTEALDSSQKELEFLRSQNASLTRKLKEFTSTSLRAAIESFKNVLQWMEYFYRPLIISSEQIWMGQILWDGMVVSILKYAHIFHPIPPSFCALHAKRKDIEQYLNETIFCCFSDVCIITCIGCFFYPQCCITSICLLHAICEPEKCQELILSL